MPLYLEHQLSVYHTDMQIRELFDLSSSILLEFYELIIDVCFEAHQALSLDDVLRYLYPHSPYDKISQIMVEDQVKKEKDRLASDLLRLKQSPDLPVIIIALLDIG